MPYPNKYTDLYRFNQSSDSVFDLTPEQIEKPVEDISFSERISLDARYGISSDAMLPCENQDETEVNDFRVRSDYDIRVSLMDQIEMRTNRDARTKSVLFNPNDYSDYSESITTSQSETQNAND